MSTTGQLPTFASGAFYTNRRDLVVEWGHCDPAGIVFNPRFVEYFDWCSALLLEAALGLKKSEMRAAYGLAGIPVVDMQLRFLGPVTYDDSIQIYSTIASLKHSSFVVNHRLLKADNLAVECSQTRVWCGHNAEDPKKLKSCAIPIEVVEKLKSKS
ncbi:acyl-CoA thioesterase [Bradyrhizobium manausense]